MSNLSAFGGAQPITPGGLVELGYGSYSAGSISVSSSNPASPTTIIPDVSVVCDGGPVLIEYFDCQTITGSAGSVYFSLWKDGAEYSRYWGVDSTSLSTMPTALQYRDTPTAGSHTYSVKAFYSGAAGTVVTGSGTTTQSPAFLRVSKIVQQNDGLKPFWTPPLVTQLPGNPSVGDTVIYAADATDGVYWHLYYDGIGSYPWKYVGGSPLHDWTNTGTTILTTGFVVDANFTGFTIPLAGDYTVETTAMGNNSTAFNWWLWKPNGCSYPAGDQYGARVSQANNGNYESASNITRVTLTTGTLNAVGRVVGGTGQVSDRSITATPVRVA